MTGAVPVSIVVPMRNEAARVADFIAAHRWAREIIVVDHASDDATAAQAEAAGARVLRVSGGTIAEARNAGADVASSDWILALDADERADAALADELRALLTGPTAVNAYRIRRRNLYLGREQVRGAWGRDWIVRVYRRGQQYTVRRVHEELIPDGPTASLQATLEHQPYRDLSHHLAKMDRYARWGAEELFARGRRARSLDFILRPAWRFVKAYILNWHCLDGRFGLVTSLLGAQTVLLKYQHLWALERTAPPTPDP